MTRRAVEVSGYNFTSQDRLFLDANIWLYNFCPDAQPPKPSPKVEIYSQAFAAILQAKSRIFIDVLVMAEFINRYARLRWGNEAPDMAFKVFRNSADFTAVAREIACQSGRVMGLCDRVESGFAGLQMEDLLDTYSEGESDFNDQVIAELCKKEKLTLVTDDGDFQYPGMSILTANRRLLN